jgi:predicted HTH transcriptional regulator
MLLGKTFDALGPEDIAALVAEAVPESVTLDFKAKTYRNGDKDKREFAKDVCAFANTRGGYLILGVAEADGVACEIAPLEVEDVDAELQRLEQIARSSIDPPLVGVRLKRVQVEGGEVIVVWVPRSYDPPHRVVSGGVNKFYGRSAAGGYELSVQELRSKRCFRL